MTTPADERHRSGITSITSEESLEAILERRFDVPRIVAAGATSDADVWIVIGTAFEDRVPDEGVRRALRAMERFANAAETDVGMTATGERVVRVRIPALSDRMMAVRYAGQMAGRAIRGVGGSRFALITDFTDADEVMACLASIRVGAYRSPFTRRSARATTLSYAGPELSDATIHEANTLSDATITSRALVETPANLLTPEVFASIVTAWAAGAGLRSEVISGSDLVKRGFIATEAIGRSSDHAPHAVVLRSDDDPDPPELVLVGKGVTFDAGGISLKPAPNMGKLKGDMAGAAAVTCAALAARALGTTTRFAVVIPLAENLPDGAALRPGDVITYADGTRVHVDNTDAEGRMLLADGVCFARSELGADRIVTIGTLTKACIVALGNWYAALYANAEDLAEAITESSRKGGERAWRMPVGEEYAYSLRNPVASIANSSEDGGGSILAATFIGSFAGSTSWAHIDMSSIFFMDREMPWADKGYTGAGARLLCGLLRAHGADEKDRRA